MANKKVYEETVKISINGEWKEIKPPTYGKVIVKYQDGKAILIEINEQQKI